MPLEHGLTQEQIDNVQNLVDQGRITEAWQQLADYGDTYADNAAAVTGDPDGAYDSLMREMVEQHWENATGSKHITGSALG